VVLDAFSRRVVGWSISHNPTAGLSTNALGMAIEQRDASRGTVIHSDHGTQFTAWTFTDRGRKSGQLPSMGSVGDCYDNAMIEAFWSRMQVELLDTRRPPALDPSGLRGRVGCQTSVRTPRKQRLQAGRQFRHPTG
jgi:transposase InsO family protein